MSEAGISLAVQQLTPWFIAMFIAGIVFMAPIQKYTDRLTAFLEVSPEDSAEADSQQTMTGKKVKAAWLIVSIICFFLLIWCMVRLSSGTYNPFIYFRF